MRSHVPDGGTVEGISFFILCIELSTSQIDTISPKLRLECGISHMRTRTPAAHLQWHPPGFWCVSCRKFTFARVAAAEPPW